MENEVYLTKEAYKELQERLALLKSEGRVDIANKIAVARSFGDISENSEYDAAREEEAALELEIMTIESNLRNAKIITKMKVDTSLINVGCEVAVKDMEFGDNLTFKISGSYDSDPTKGIISNESPIGKALIGKKKGDIVEVVVPATKMVSKYKIINFKY